VLLAHVEEDVLTQRLGALEVRRLKVRNVGAQRRVEALRDVDVLVEPAHRIPEFPLLEVERRVVLAQFVLPVPQGVEDRVEVALRALVLAEVVGDLVPEGDHAEDLAWRRGLRGVEVLDRPAQFDQRCAHLRARGEPTLRDRPDRRLEESVGALGGVPDVRVAHGPDVTRLGRELRRVRRRGQK